MSYHAAAEALRTANIPAYHRWTGGWAHTLATRHRIQLVWLYRLKPRLGGELVRRLAAGPWDALAAENGKGRSIIVAKHDRAEARIIWSVVHELGHILLGHPPGQINLQDGTIVDAPAWAEAEAHRFARHVLLPADEMREFLRWRTRPDEIARRKGVSRDAVLVRMETMHRYGEFDRWLEDAG